MKSQILSCSIEVTWCSQSTAYYRLESLNHYCSLTKVQICRVGLFNFGKLLVIPDFSMVQLSFPE